MKLSIINILTIIFTVYKGTHMIIFDGRGYDKMKLDYKTYYFV